MPQAIRVQVPRLGVLEFPQGTSEAEMIAAIDRQMATLPPVPTKPADLGIDPGMMMGDPLPGQYYRNPDPVARNTEVMRDAKIAFPLMGATLAAPMTGGGSLSLLPATMGPLAAGTIGVAAPAVASALGTGAAGGTPGEMARDAATMTALGIPGQIIGRGIPALRIAGQARKDAALAADATRAAKVGSLLEEMKPTQIRTDMTRPSSIIDPDTGQPFVVTEAAQFEKPSGFNRDVTEQARNMRALRGAGLIDEAPAAARSTPPGWLSGIVGGAMPGGKTGSAIGGAALAKIWDSWFNK